MKDSLLFILSTLFIIACIFIMTSGTQQVYAEPTDSASDQENNVEEINDQEYSVPTINNQEEPWLIQVDMYNQVVTVFAKDAEGAYNTIIKEFPCSTGIAANDFESRTPYVVKELELVDEQRSNWYLSRDWGKWGWVEYITNIEWQYLFHSILYGDDDFDDFIHDSYTDLTFPASHGCVRMPSEGVKWIYDNIKQGTIVSITKTPPSPELTQSLQPMPPKDGNIVATFPPDFEPRVTEEPQVKWERFNWDRENFLEDWGVSSDIP